MSEENMRDMGYQNQWSSQNQDLCGSQHPKEIPRQQFSGSTPRTFKVGDKVQMRDGRKVELLRNLNHPLYKLGGIVTENDGTQYIFSWSDRGEHIVDAKTDMDLVLAPETIQVVVKVFPPLRDDDRVSADKIYPHLDDKESIVRWAKADGAIAVKFIEIKVGEFD